MRWRGRSACHQHITGALLELDRSLRRDIHTKAQDAHQLHRQPPTRVKDPILDFIGSDLYGSFNIRVLGFFMKQHGTGSDVGF